MDLDLTLSVTPFVTPFFRSAAMLALFLLMFLMAKYLKRFLTPYNLEHQLTGKDNLAQATSLAGYYIGFTAVFCGAYLGPSAGLLWDLLAVAGYTLLGMALLNLSRILNDRLVFRGFSMVTAIRDHHNVSAGVIQGANYVASGLVVAGAVHGEDGGVLTALVFYLVGQLALLLFSRLYERLTPYSIHREIGDGNLAAGLGFGGSMVAIGLVILASLNGDFVSWSYNLGWLGINLLGVFLYLFLVRCFFDRVVISHDDLNKEIAEDRNAGAGLLECTLAVSFATVLFFMIG